MSVLLGNHRPFLMLMVFVTGISLSLGSPPSPLGEILGKSKADSSHSPTSDVIGQAVRTCGCEGRVQGSSRPMLGNCTDYTIIMPMCDTSCTFGSKDKSVTVVNNCASAIMKGCTVMGLPDLSTMCKEDVCVITYEAYTFEVTSCAKTP